MLTCVAPGLLLHCNASSANVVTHFIQHDATHSTKLHLTRVDAFCLQGTLTHMAPELLLHGRVSSASDVYNPTLESHLMLAVLCLSVCRVR
jgi:serine/threonine protein kinase